MKVAARTIAATDCSDVEAKHMCWQIIDYLQDKSCDSAYKAEWGKIEADAASYAHLALGLDKGNIR
jgi:hypothetical protein